MKRDRIKLASQNRHGNDAAILVFAFLITEEEHWTG
jgi:hypothetical protein